MRQRLAIVISGITAAAILAVGLSAAGFGPVSGLAAGAPSGGEVDTAQADATPEPEVVYVKPAPKRKTVVVTERVAKSSTVAKSKKAVRRATAAKPAARSKPAASRRRDDDDRHEEREHENEREHEREHEREKDHEEDDD
jgi:hypothetical protein